ETEEVLLGAGRIAALTTHPAAVFTSRIEREREGGLAESFIRLIVVLDLEAVIGMDALAARVAQRICSPVIVEDERNGAVPTPQAPPANSWRPVEFAIRLPAIDDPRLDFQLVAGKDLNSHAVEEPRRVGRDV